MKLTTPLPRRFALQRRLDISGVSGTGLVAYGTVYPTGRTTLAWCAGDITSVSIYDSPEEVERIHGHNGATVLVWIDQEMAQRRLAEDSLRLARSRKVEIDERM